MVQIHGFKPQRHRQYRGILIAEKRFRGYIFAMTGSRQSLRDLYPKRVEVPFLIVASVILLGIGLSLPLVKVEKMVFWNSTYSVITGTKGLMDSGQHFLAVILFTFGVIFPTAKLIGLGFLWLHRLEAERRRTILLWLGILGRWSMLDVLGVAVLITMIKLKPWATVQVQSGLYVFGSAILLSMLTNTYVELLAHKRR